MSLIQYRRKHFFSNILIGISIVLIAIVLLWSTMSEYFSLEEPEKLFETLTNAAYNCQYKGNAQNGGRYILKAKKIKELQDECFEIEYPNIFFETEDKKTYHVTSDEMLFDKKTMIAFLKGNVFFKTSDDVIMKTETTKVDVNQERIEGDDFVECIQNDSNISGIGFDLDYKTGKITFKNRPTMTILSENK
ncbi:MAG: LPS export ABC transporter periplasmic protein LptC [Proteobacteria bacterium]|nr:LPS export ABC transporter periplasmic protein LptC [Pseudomonadota bacterium]